MAIRFVAALYHRTLQTATFLALPHGLSRAIAVAAIRHERSGLVGMDGEISDLELVRYLIEERSITWRDGDISATNLNPEDHRHLRRYVPKIARLLWERVAQSGMTFDAIASIPTSGNEYVRHLVTIALEKHGRIVPRVPLQKSHPRFDAFRPLTVEVGARVLLVDDAVYTGATARDAISALRDVGLEVAGFAFVAEIRNSETEIRKPWFFGSWCPSVSVFNRESMRPLIA